LTLNTGQKSKPPVPSNRLYRIDYGRLLNHVLDGRDLARIPMLYGSEPPPNDSVWNVIRSKGFDVRVFKRNIYNKEKGVDMRMGLDIGKLVLTEKKSTVIMVAGDADFIQVVDDVHDGGWEVDAWYWSRAAADLKRAVDRFVSLNRAVYEFGYDTAR
jgi:uncharacterized LabA/DUF88 family protein